MVFIAVGMVIWQVTQPIVSIVSGTMLNASRSMGTNTTVVERGITIIDAVNVVWIIIYIIAWLTFGFLFGSRKEGEGQYTQARF
jgi:hypothetical protein